MLPLSLSSLPLLRNSMAYIPISPTRNAFDTCPRANPALKGRKPQESNSWLQYHHLLSYLHYNNSCFTWNRQQQRPYFHSNVTCNHYPFSFSRVAYCLSAVSSLLFSPQEHKGKEESHHNNNCSFLLVREALCPQRAHTQTASSPRRETGTSHTTTKKGPGAIKGRAHNHLDTI